MSVVTIDDIAAWLTDLAPLELAEEWDNVGLLVGDRLREVRRLMTCLTITPATAAEAISAEADLVVVHHPLPFRPLNRITTDTVTGRLLWDLIGAGIAVYSAHTAYDSARNGINCQWCRKLGLEDVGPLVSAASLPGQAEGAGRLGRLPHSLTLDQLAGQVKGLLSLPQIRIVGDGAQPITRVAVACGSGGAFLDAARAKECDCLITGEASFHTCLEAEASRIGLVLCGHYASERFAMEALAEALAQSFPVVNVWASRDERDPLRSL